MHARGIRITAEVCVCIALILVGCLWMRGWYNGRPGRESKADAQQPAANGQAALQAKTYTKGGAAVRAAKARFSGASAGFPSTNASEAALLIRRARDVRVERDPELGTPVFVRSTSRFLTPSCGGLPQEEVAKRFISANARFLGVSLVDLTPPNACVSRSFLTRHNGMYTVTYQQTHDGLPLEGATLTLHLTRLGEVINVSSRALPVSELTFVGTPNEVSAADAVVRAARALAVELSAPPVALSAPAGVAQEQAFAGPQELKEPARAQKLFFPTDAATAALAWEVILTVRGSAETRRLLIDATDGHVLQNQSLTYGYEPATYNVYTNDSPMPFSPGLSAPSTNQPPAVPRTQVTLAALDAAASPNGWIPDGASETLGNNVDVYADWDDNNSPDGQRTQGTSYRVFDAPLDLSGSPVSYLNASCAQAFYLGNVFHDRLYQLGFDEAAGNFQSDNLGRGGKGGDALRIEVQDGASITDGTHRNNANFSTLDDGTTARMQLYIWSRVVPNRDAALDAEVVFHEYTHGVSVRLVGAGAGLNGTQPRGLAEGWSDFMSLALLSQPGDDVAGCYPCGGYCGANRAYPYNYYYGIRRFPYSTDLEKAPQTFADADPGQIGFPASVPINITASYVSADECHRMGEIWCLALWECRANLIEREGFSGNERMLQLVVDGLKLTPVNPTYLQARDALLQADLVTSGGAYQLQLWKGFAKRGLGYSATSPSSATAIGIRESFDLPIQAAVTVEEAPGADGDGRVEPGESGLLRVTLSNPEFGLSGVSGTLAALSDHVAVTQASTSFPDFSAGGASESATPFAIAVAPEFPGFTDALFLLTVTTGSGDFTQQLAVRIGNPADYPPEISNLGTISVTETNALVAWTTGIPANARVYYGPTADYGSSTALDTAMTTSHVAKLENLTRGVTYHYCVASVGSNGLSAVSGDQTFRTLAIAHVNAASTAPLENGSTSAPYKTIQAAVNAASPGDAVHIAEGTYVGTLENIVTVGAGKSLVLQGGFSGDFSERDPGRHVTLLDGELSRRGVAVTDGGTLVLDGVTIVRGACQWGGAINVKSASLTARRCTLADCASTGVNRLGGGVFGTLGSTVTLTGCVISNNAANYGGGVFVTSEGTVLTMSDCVVAKNTSGFCGGGVNICSGAAGTLQSCTVFGNISTNSNGHGGGVEVSSYSQATITQCTISRNNAKSTLAGYGGGGVDAYSSTDPTTSAFVWLNNSILYDNTCSFGADLRCGTCATVYCNFNDVGDFTGTPKTQVGQSSANPLFANAGAGDFHLLPLSPCIDAGLLMDDAILDCDGETRPFGATVDLGADEYCDTDGDAVPDYRDPDDDNDGMPDEWEKRFGLSPVSNDAAQDPDRDGFDNLAEYVADTDPSRSSSAFPPLALSCEEAGLFLSINATSTARTYGIESTESLCPANWQPVTNTPGTGGPLTFTIFWQSPGARFFRSKVAIP